MASVRATSQLDVSRLNAYLAGPVRASLGRGGQAARNHAVAIIDMAGRVDKGKMKQSIEARVGPVVGTKISVSVETRVYYAKWQHEGSQQIIYPTRKRALRWRPKGGGGWRFARSVRGIWPGNPTEPLPFLTRALKRLRVSDFL